MLYLSDPTIGGLEPHMNPGTIMIFGCVPEPRA